MNYHQWSFKDHSLTAIVISLLPILRERKRIRCRHPERTSAQASASTLILGEDADGITAINRNPNKTPLFDFRCHNKPVTLAPNNGPMTTTH